MQAILIFLAAVAVIGSRGHRMAAPLPRGLLVAMSVLLALALYSRRIV